MLKRILGWSAVLSVVTGAALLVVLGPSVVKPLDAGVHVLVEKPMTLRAAEAWDLVERAKKNNLHLMVGYTYQFTRHAQAARNIVQSGRIGDLQLISGVFTSWVESYLRGNPQEYAEASKFPVTGPEADSYSGGEYRFADLTACLEVVN